MESGESLTVPTCGITATCNPDPEVFKRVADAAVSQLDHLIIIENGSSKTFRSELSDWCGHGNPGGKSGLGRTTVVYNESNLGLSKAFNQALKIALPRGHQRIVFLDHDSVLMPGAVSALQTEYSRLEQQYHVGALLALNQEKRNLPTDKFLEGYFRRRGMFSDGNVREVMLLTNSGTFVDSAIFDRVGLFDESYFVDAVDFEFSLRLISRGYRLFAVDSARIEHSRGVLDERKIGGWSWGFHRPAVWREYFVARDTLRTVLRYGRTVPVMGLYLCYVPVRELAASFLFYGQPLKRAVELTRGIVDAFR